MKIVLRSTALFAALVLAGCASVGPDYHAPKEAPVTLQGVDATHQNNGDVQARWWKQFGDPTLDALIVRAAQGSPDLKIAVARLNQARAALGSAKSQQIPDIETGVSVPAQPRAAARLQRSAPDRHRLPGRLRCLVGTRPVRWYPPVGRGRARRRRRRRGVAAGCAGHVVRRSGAQLLRPARHAAAHRRGQAGHRQPAGFAEGDRRAASSLAPGPSRTSPARRRGLPPWKRSCPCWRPRPAPTSSASRYCSVRARANSTSTSRRRPSSPSTSASPSAVPTRCCNGVRTSASPSASSPPRTPASAWPRPTTSRTSPWADSSAFSPAAATISVARIRARGRSLRASRGRA